MIKIPFLSKKAKEVFQPSQTTAEVIEQIHHEFNTAGENLLKEALEIINSAPILDAEKTKRLEQLGFRQTAEVVKFREIESTKLKAAELAKIVEDYSFRYPNHKFITEEAVKRICEKYNLVCAEVSRYKGFVPDKNLREIEAFKIQDKDRLYEQRIVGYSSRWSIISREQYVKETKPKEREPNPLDSFDSIARYMLSERDLQNRNSGYSYEELTELMICAPSKDMDLTDADVIGYKVVKREVPGPVVLRRVMHGYLILTAWGDEASDTDVVNQKMN